MDGVAPEALLEALGVEVSSIRRIDRLPDGLGGGVLLRLTVERSVGAATWRERLIAKIVTPQENWLSASAGDTLLREVQLWRRGLLRLAPLGITTGVRRWALLGDQDRPAAGALLMDDLGPRLHERPDRTPPGRLPAVVVAILEGLAALHARYWQEPRLGDPTLDLMSPRDALLLLAPERIHTAIARGDSAPYLGQAQRGWDTFFSLAATDDGARLRAVLADSAPCLAAIARLPATLVHGDMWRPNLGWLPPTDTAPRLGSRLILLDWALAMAGPATYDPLWLCGTWHALDPRRVLAAYRAALNRRLQARSVRLSAGEWRALADAGYLRTTLTCGEALGRAALDAPAGHARRRAEERVRWWARRGAQAADRLAASDSPRGDRHHA